jgi:hypothetical protein
MSAPTRRSAMLFHATGQRIRKLPVRLEQIDI